MKYLAIDTASAALKILLKIDGASYYFQSDDYRSASESLLPEIDKLLVGAGITLSGLDFLSCVIGPGSFTGIRIGMAAIKAFAYASGLKVKAVNTLQLLAYNNSGKADTVVSVCDAGNGYRYVAVYDEKVNKVLEPKCLKIEELEDFLKLIDEPIELFLDNISKASLGCGVVPGKENFARALALASEKAEAMAFNDIEPMYIRKPQAEKDLENK